MQSPSVCSNCTLPKNACICDRLKKRQPLCQGCTNVKNECMCSEYTQEYCNDCGNECDGVHSVTRSKTVEDKAEELAKIVLSYDKNIVKQVIKYLSIALNSGV